MKTRGGEVDRDTVLMLLANMLLEFTDGIQVRGGSLLSMCGLC